MESNDMRPDMDVLSLTDTEVFIYEAVATLEYTGQPTTREHIRQAVNMNDATVDTSLGRLTNRGLLTVTESDGEQIFEPSNRGWSAAPEQGQGM